MVVARVSGTDTAEQTPTGHFISLRAKLLIGFTLIFSLVFAVAYYWFYTYASGVAEARLTDALHNALVGTAAGIDGDELVALLNEAERNEEGYTDDPRYWKIAEWLHTVHELDARAWPYTYVEGDEPREVIYVVSSGALEDPPWGVKFKDTEITTTTNMQVGLRQPSAFLDYTYEWEGTEWVSGYGPIYNAEGEVVAGIGIDYNFDYVLAVRNEVRNRAIPAFLITYSVLFISVWLLSNYLTRPIKRLTRVAERIGEGDYTQDVSALTTTRFPDEITILGRVFGSMTRKVERREVQLKERVMELEITLDLQKRDQQVREIVDTDFFQDLQSKAREMRSRRHRHPHDVVESAGAND